MHLEMCIKDLRERFARIDLHVSAPLVAFRESALYPLEAPDITPKTAKVRTADVWPAGRSLKDSRSGLATCSRISTAGPKPFLFVIPILNAFSAALHCSRTPQIDARLLPATKKGAFKPN